MKIADLTPHFDSDLNPDTDLHFDIDSEKQGYFEIEGMLDKQGLVVRNLDFVGNYKAFDTWGYWNIFVYHFDNVVLNCYNCLYNHQFYSVNYPVAVIPVYSISFL